MKGRFDIAMATQTVTGANRPSGESSWMENHLGVDESSIERIVQPIGETSCFLTGLLVWIKGAVQPIY